jgi:hypothetical protein
VSFPFSTSTVLAEELINTVGKGLRILPINVDDQRRTLLVAVLNHERDMLKLDLTGVLELVDHHVLVPQLLSEVVIFTQKHEREQLEEPEVQVVPPKRKLEIGVIYVVDEPLESRSALLEDAFAIYSSEPGFMDAIGSVSGPSLAVRTAPHDDLVMEEPGPYSAPIPGAIRHR